MQTLIIEPEYLHQHLHDPDLLVVDVRAAESYERGHIPGAINVRPSELICGIKPAVGKLPGVDSLKKLFSRIGYDNNKYIVSYDDEGGGWAGRFIWTLHVIGHQKCSLLNGGIIAWDFDGLPLTDELSDPVATSPAITLHKSPVAEKEDILAALHSEDTVIWDARSEDEFFGRKLAALRGGHIPGAINLDWLHTMDRNRSLRLRADIDQLLEDKGINQGKSVITHCQTHHRSGLTYVIGKHLGFNIKAYHGSWSEWGNDQNLPIET